MIHRMQLVELEDLPWLPASLRDMATDYLQMLLHISNPYATIAPHLRRAMDAAGGGRVLDLASGGGGPWARLLPLIAAGGAPAHVTLSDRYPNSEAFAQACRRFPGVVDACHEPVDATRVPPGLAGLRTIFSAFHHFPPNLGRAIIADAVRQGRGIAIFEATQRDVATIAAMLLTPLLVWLLTPLIRPLTPARLMLTYLLPVIPAIVLFDGLVSCLRSYTADELRALVDRVEGAEGYRWEIGEEPALGSPLKITYCVGVPR
ncbi:MAG: class I SAM-dependent methyltransferase [Chloroflexales bacterium]|nr:class I SAM-dependent methyltransferase [Chloroflexales bacterium]